MELPRYLGLMRQLYMEGAQSRESQLTLTQLGGSMALAAKDWHTVHVEEDAVLWLDMERSPQEKYDQALASWRLHETKIVNAVKQGKTPAQAIFDHMRSHNTKPHKPESIVKMLEQHWMPDGSVVSAWKVPIIKRRAHMERTMNMMTGSSFGAITTMVALAVTADDFHNATPEEWSRAMDYGDVANLVTSLAGDHASAKVDAAARHRQAMPQASTRQTRAAQHGTSSHPPRRY